MRNRIWLLNRLRNVSDDREIMLTTQVCHKNKFILGPTRWTGAKARHVDEWLDTWLSGQTPAKKYSASRCNSASGQLVPSSTREVASGGGRSLRNSSAIAYLPADIYRVTHKKAPLFGAAAPPKRRNEDDSSVHVAIRPSNIRNLFPVYLLQPY